MPVTANCRGNELFIPQCDRPIGSCLFSSKALRECYRLGAERFGWSPFAVRLVFLLSCLLPGPQFIIYLVLWVIMPRRPY